MIDYQLSFSIVLNGVAQDPVTLPASWRLIDYLHELKGLTGTKLGCGAGYCKACTVCARTDEGNFAAIPACSTSLHTCNGWEITTIEALGSGVELHPLQQAIVDENAFQCGYCTPGFLMESLALYNNLEGRTLTDATVDELLSGALEAHLCRCTGYQRYHDALGRALRARVDIRPAPRPAAAASDAGGAPDAKVLTTNPRWELARLLHDAAEVEHGLLLQYLFAAFSLKRPVYASLAGFGHQAPGTPLDLLAVTIEEMSHLDTVNRFLVDLGGAPHLARRDYPWKPANYPFPFSLEPLSPGTLAKYTWVEAGRGRIDHDPPVKAAMEANLPADPGFHRVGSIYAHIRSVLAKARKAEPGLVDWRAWDARGLRNIQAEGEDDHYALFRSLLLGTHPGFHGLTNPWALPADHPLHPVLHYQVDPTASTGQPNTIPGEIPRRVATLANRHYWVAMGLLELSYRRNGIYHPAARRHMVGPLLQLGWHLAQTYGTGMPFDPAPVRYQAGIDEKTQAGWLLALLDDIDASERELTGYLPAAYQRSSNETRTQLRSLA